MTATSTRTARAKPSPRKKTRKVSKTYRLNAAQIEAARKALGVETATEAIEQALDVVLFRQELMVGTARTLGLRIARGDD